jgi:hypothetical protein
MPNLARSYRLEAVHIISMAQQANPKTMGHTELRLDQLYILSKLVINTLFASSLGIGTSEVNVPVVVVIG